MDSQLRRSVCPSPHSIFRPPDPLTERSASRRSDVVNERLPVFDTAGDHLVTAPSMRQENMEDLIKKALAENEGNSVVDNLADKIARGRKPQGRPRALKRFETA